jgi:hypothetical protein
VIRRQQTMPDEITELARILNYWQGHYLIEQKSRALRELQRDALAALATLANVFPRLRDLTKSFEANAVQDQAPPVILAILRKRLAEIDAARDFIAKAEGFSVWPTRRLHRIAGNGSRTFCRSILEMQCVRPTRIIRQGLVTMVRSPDSLPL